MPATKTYDAAKVTVIVGTRILSGFAPDAMVSVEQDEDAFTKQIGVTGEATRSKSNNLAGKITISLIQSSADNDFLSGLANADQLSNSGLTTVLIRDQGGRSLHLAPEAWVQKLPVGEYNREAGPREWVMDCGRIISTFGGN